MLSFTGPSVETIARVALAASDDETRYSLQGVYIAPSRYRAGRYDVVATSGKILAHACIEPEPGSSPMAPSRGALLPPEMLRELSRHYRWTVRKGEGSWRSPPGYCALEIDVTSEVGEGTAALQVGGARVRFSLMAEAYPDYPIALEPYLKASLRSSLDIGAMLNPRYILTAARILGLQDDATIMGELVGRDASSPQVAVNDGVMVLVMPLVPEKGRKHGQSAEYIREHLGVSKPKVSAASAA